MIHNHKHSWVFLKVNYTLKELVKPVKGLRNVKIQSRAIENPTTQSLNNATQK